MGFVDHQTLRSGTPLTASDYIWLAALGAAERGPITLDSIASAVESLAGCLWQPVFEVIADNVDEMAKGGFLDEQDGRIMLTPPGRFCLAQLLARPVHAPLSAFGQVGVRLKMAFLDLLPKPSRQRQIQALIVAYECEIASRSTRCGAWPLSGMLGRGWLDHQMDTLEDSLHLLRKSARMEET
ncbi:hypothetical protein CU669_06760 [Paramagnetospirillum kuznetsovii]|uniref:Uncharacterized protein n=1 Tax=Paramagnetospirillum kuznetsovii TaxID=2053833 RepID=A0A364P0Q4_9PROT|nr:hypothetical protein [Paramagnetospirillum kuznetsovii]RAU22695.1 hypothetical protein CU669_06760 [Paramagnetospirillum kuznetsovii]